MSGLSFVASIEIDRKLSDENINEYFERIGKDNVLTSSVVLDPNSLIDLKKQFEGVSNLKIGMDSTGITNVVRTVKDEMDNLVTVSDKFNKKTQQWEQSISLTSNELAKQKDAYNSLEALVKKLGLLDKERVSLSGQMLKANKEETKIVKDLIKEKRKTIKNDGLENAELEVKISNQMLENARLLNREMAKKSDNKQAQSYDKLLKAMKQELAYKKQKIGANEKEIKLLDEKIKKEQSKQASARTTLWRNQLNTKDMDKVVADTKSLYELELKVTQEKHEQTRLYKEINEIEQSLHKNALKYSNAGNSTERLILNKEEARLQLELEEKRQELISKGLIDSEKELDLQKLKTKHQDELNIKQAQHQQMLEEQNLLTEEYINKKKRELGIKTQNLITKNGDYIQDEDIAKLDQLQRKIKELNGVSTKDVRRQVEMLEVEIKELSSNATKRKLEDTNKALNSFQVTLNNVAKYVSATLIIRELWEQFKVGTQYIKELDEAYTDVAISMDISREKFNEWVQDARGIAQANGVLTTDIMEMVKIYATAGESIEQIESKLSGTAMIQNITKWDAEQTTSAVNSIINQYKLLEKEINGTTGNVSNAIQYMGDVLIGISNALTVDNVAGIQEMVKAIDTAGGIMEQSGASMEWYMAIAGTLKETMNTTGEEVGNAFKMINY